jgi:DNA invertase Pin-like site-specific DNA recombinase
MLIGYMCVSKADGSQMLDLQRDALLAVGVEPGHLYEDQASGKRDNRLGLEACLRRCGRATRCGMEARSARPRPAPSGQSRP